MKQEQKVDAYGYSKTLDVGHQEAIERTKAALKAEGFGALFELDLKEKLKEKLGVEFRNYVILGACNPPIAYQTLQEEIEIGLLLPCNVIVYEQDGKSVVSAINAERMMTVVDNPKVDPSAAMVNEKLRRVIDSL
jgi:uncharacterized protein (DUF302 family)